TKWEGFYQSGIAAQAAGKFDVASGLYHDAARIDGDFAELQFREGACALALGGTNEAQKAFAAARDLDTLRFRCDTRLNDLIRQAVSRQNDQRVVLADAEHDFAEESPNGLPGSDLFYEHVHLTFEGNYRLARSIAPKVEGLLPGRIAGPAAASQPWPTEADCARRLAWSDWDRQKNLSEMLSRLNNPPFTAQISHDEQVQRIRTSLSGLTAASQPAGIQAAQTFCENAVVAAPDDPLLHAQLAALDELSGNLDGALTNAQRTVELLPSSSEDWSELGVILAKQQKYEDATSAFRRAFQLNSEDVWALQGLAQSLNDLGRSEEAIREYRHALAVKPRFGLAWIGLGQIFEKMGRQAEAQDCYHKALENRINRAPELTTLARLCETHGWHEAAATNYDDAIKLSPMDATLYVEAGQNYSAAGRNGDAAARYAEAVRLSPDSLQAHFLYGLELGKQGEASDAAVQFREAVRIMPNLPEARLNLGMALENEGNYSEALEQFEKVLEQSPSNAMALEHTRALKEKLALRQGH
ncbi:MAG TPA: tetratricopeptide repeat protein, partial [Verrucomicrobiae bacterium]|nr:tetratricopeptide repeat protein [Verrucomicrobiae bacterium]